jgi:hypothetical protein
MYSDILTIHSYIETALATIGEGIAACFFHAYHMATEFSQTEIFQTNLLRVLWLYSHCAVVLERGCKRLYDNNEIIRAPIDTSIWLYEQAVIISSNKKHEPNAANWISVCRLVKSEDASMNRIPYLETYRIVSHPLIDEMAAHFENAFTSVLCLMNIPEDTNDDNANEPILSDHAKQYIHDMIQNDTLIIMKTETHRLDDPNGFAYRVYLCNRRSEVVPELNLFLHSKYRLLSASYTCPGRTEPIALNIPREMFIVGNEILSPAFVRRCLEYQGYGDVFSMDYTIDLIDGEINQSSMKSHQYLWIGADGAGIGLL